MARLSGDIDTGIRSCNAGDIGTQMCRADRACSAHADSLPFHIARHTDHLLLCRRYGWAYSGPPMQNSPSLPVASIQATGSRAAPASPSGSPTCSRLRVPSSRNASGANNRRRGAILWKKPPASEQMIGSDRGSVAEGANREDMSESREATGYWHHWVVADRIR